MVCLAEDRYVDDSFSEVAYMYMYLPARLAGTANSGFY